MGGKFIVIEGLDGSGKATQTAILAQQLQNSAVQILGPGANYNLLRQNRYAAVARQVVF